MTTTKEIVTHNNSLKVYWRLEIKRRTAVATWEADWLDITGYLLEDGCPKISQKLDSEGYGYGEFKTDNATFKIDNSGGVFFPQSSALSLFAGYFSRHYTKVKYTCGYYDDTGTEIEEVVFQGLLNEKTISTDFETAITSFTALGMSAVFSERDTSSTLTGVMTASAVINAIFSGNTYLLSFINYSAGNINPAINTTFDDCSKFASRSVNAVLSQIAKDTYSVWYVDIQTNNLILRTRTENAAAPLSLDQDKDIIKLYDYQEGFDKIINKVTYKSTGTNIFTATQTELDTYGTTGIGLGEGDSDPLTTFDTIKTLCDTIILTEKIPKRRLKVNTIYYPNVFSLYCKVSPIYVSKKNQVKNILRFNGSTFWNGGYLYKTKGIALSIDENIVWKTLGIENDTKSFQTSL